MWDSEEGRKTIAFVLLAGSAGLLGHLMRVVESEGKIRWLVAALEGLSSGFVGFLAVLMCKAMGLSYEWTGVVVGILGWLGAAVSVRMIESIIRKRLGLTEGIPFSVDHKETKDD